MIFTQTGDKGMVPTMLKVSQEWHLKVEDKSATPTPLRMVMITALFKELELRSQKVMQATPDGQMLRAELVKARLMSEDGQRWNQVQWSAEQAQLVPVDAPTLSTAQAHTLPQEILHLVQQTGLVLRFHALKSLQRVETRDGNTAVPWKLVIGLRGDLANQLHAKLQVLCHCAMTQLVMARMRQANMRRSPLAQQLSQMPYASGLRIFAEPYV